MSLRMPDVAKSLTSKGQQQIKIIIRNSNSLDGLGAPRTFGKPEEMVFLGRGSGGEEKDYGDNVGEEIDLAVSELINRAYEDAVQAITTHQPKLVRLAEYLIEYETAPFIAIILILTRQRYVYSINSLSAIIFLFIRQLPII